MGLTIHFQKIPDWFGEFVDRCQGQLEYVVGVDVFPDVPGVKVLGRTYLPDGESGALVDRGAAGADAWIAKFGRVYNDNPHVHKWIGPNEYIIWDSDSADRFNAFHVRFIQTMSGLGYGVVCGQINVGWPRLRLFNDPPPYPEALAPTLDALWLHDGLFSLHEYGPGDMRDGAGAHCLRYRNTRAELIAAGITDLPDFIITETGIDVPNPAAPQGHQGWRDFTDWAGYFDQLKWYSSELDKDPYMLGASIFTVADDWWTFQLHREEALPLADWIASDTNGNGSGEEDMDVRVWGLDDQGNAVEKSWQWAVDRYGVRLVEADPPDGATVYRLTELRQKLGPCGLQVKVIDEEGNPLEGIVVLQGWDGEEAPVLPDDAAPRLSETWWMQPDGKPNKGNGGFTNSDGDHGWGWGGGEQYDLAQGMEGAHWYWVMPGDDKWYSDVPLNFGWLWGSDHDHLDITLTRTTAENGNGGNGEDPDLEAMIAQLKRIADGVEYMAAHWPYK